MLPMQATTLIETLREIPLHRPATAGADWRGVQHAQLVDEIQRQLVARGLEVDYQRFWVYRLGADLDASFVLQNLGGPHNVLSLSVSNAKRKQLRFYVGTYDPQWSGRFVTETFYARNRYTYKFDLAAEVEEALDKAEQGFKRQYARLDRLRAAPVSFDTAFTILARSGDTHLINRSKIYEAVQQFRDQPVRSLYGLAAAFSLAIEPGTPVGQLDALAAFYQLLIACPTPEPVGAA